MRLIGTFCVVAALCFAYTASASSGPPHKPSTSSSDKQSVQIAVKVQGSFPSVFIANNDGSIAFQALPPTGSTATLQVMDAAGHYHLYGPKGPPITPVAVSESYVVGTINYKFLVFDRATGKLIAERYIPNLRALPNSHMAWIENGLLAVEAYRGGYCESDITYLRLPNLAKVKSVPLSFFGPILSWGNSYVGLGYRCGNPFPVPVVTVFSSSPTLAITSQASIADSKERNGTYCSLGPNSAPIISGNLLIFGSGCGGIRVFDLSKMIQVAQHQPFSRARHLQFAASDGYLLAIGEDASQGIATEFSLPSLVMIGNERFAGDVPVVSGNNTFAFQGTASPPYTPSVTIYPDSLELVPHKPLAESLMAALHNAKVAWSSTGDLYRAISVAQETGLVPLPVNAVSLPPKVQDGLAWYAGLLMSTRSDAAEGLTMLQALHLASPGNKDISSLLRAAAAWRAALIGFDHPSLESLSPIKSAFFMGPSMLGPIAATSQYVVAGPLCDKAAPDAPTKAQRAAIHDLVRRSLSDCYAGIAGIAVYAAPTLAMQAYVPIMVDGPYSQEYVNSIAILGHTAYATIGSLIADVPTFDLVAVDLRRGRVTADRPITPYSQVWAVSGALIGCISYRDTCQKINPATLLPGLAVKGLYPAQPFTPSTVFSQLAQKGLGRYVDNTIAMTADALLIQDDDFKLKIIGVQNAKAITLDHKFDAIPGFGVSSPDGHYSYITGVPVAPAPVDSQLVRVDMTNGDTKIIGDGPASFITRVGPLLVYLTDGALQASNASTTLQVRDANSGRFLCAWRLPSPKSPAVIGLYGAASSQSLLLVRRPSQELSTLGSSAHTEYGLQSLALSIPRFISQSLLCGRQTAITETSFDEALARLAP